jgi:hypothetical protein
MNTESTTTNKDKKNKSFGINKGSVIIFMLVVMIVLLSAAGGFWAGNTYGQAKGKKAAVGQITDLLNPLNAISNNPAFPYTVIGKVSKVNNQKVTVKLPNGDEKSVAISDKTKVSQGSNVKTINDIKKDANITVFTIGKGSNEAASRIIIR